MANLREMKFCLPSTCPFAFLVTVILASQVVPSASQISYTCPDRCYCTITTIFCNSRGLTNLTSLPTAGVDGVTKLQLSGNYLSTISEGGFSAYSGVTHLYLQYNKVSIVLHRSSFVGLSSLKRLYLSNGDLSALPQHVFNSLVNLEELYLENNNLTSLPQDVFSSLVNLERLYLHNNNLTALQQDVFSSLVNLGWLFLHNNNLTSLTQDVFSSLVNLERLYLHNNNLTSLPQDVFSSLVNLGWLLLHNNNLTAVPPGTFSGLNKIYILSLFANKYLDCRVITEVQAMYIEQLVVDQDCGNDTTKTTTTTSRPNTTHNHPRSIIGEYAMSKVTAIAAGGSAVLAVSAVLIAWKVIKAAKASGAVGSTPYKPAPPGPDNTSPPDRDLLYQLQDRLPTPVPATADPVQNGAFPAP